MRNIVIATYFLTVVAALVVKEADYSVPSVWTKSNRVDGSKPFTLTFAVKHKNIEELERTFYEVSNPRHQRYGKHLTMDQLIDLVGPTETSVSQVLNWLHAHDIRDYRLTRGREYIVAETTVSTVESLLSTKLFTFVNKKTGTTVTRSESPYYLPDDIAPFIDFKTNDSTRSLHQSPKQSIPVLSPSMIKDALNIPSNLHGSSNITQAVSQFDGQYFTSTDLSLFQTIYNLTQQQPTVVMGPNDPTKPGFEATLDLELIMAVAQEVPTWMVSIGGNYTQEPFLDWVLLMLNTTGAPLVQSVSYGDYESDMTADYILRVDQEFQKFGALGHSILFASGDWGVGCNQQCSSFVPDWPATSPHVTAVGGMIDTATVDPNSSGGFSFVYEMPEYQQSTVKMYLSNNKLPPMSLFNVSGRAFPDVCSFSDNVGIVLRGSNIPVSGTSCAAPVFAAVVSLLNDARISVGKSPLGFLNPFLYQTQASHPDAFGDPYLGNNGHYCCTGFNATTGWDPRLGFPNFPNLLKYALQLQ